MTSKPIQLFENLMSPNNDVRKSAENSLNELKKRPPKEILPVFAEGMSSSNETTFQFCMVIFKKTFLEEKGKLDTFSEEEKNSLITLVKSKIDFSGAKSWKSLQRIGEALSPLYQATNLPNGFVDILKWFSDQSNALSRKFAIFLIEVLCTIEAINEKVLDSGAITNFKNIFSKGLEDPDINVKVSSLNCITQFLININDETTLHFSELTDKMLSALIETLKHESNADISESKGKAALETMIEIIELHPKFWKDKTDTIINIVNEICKGKIFKNEIRECALELVYALAKHTPSTVKKSGNFKNMFIPLLFNLMLEIDNENDDAKWEKDIEENEEEKDEMFYGVKDSFDRLAVDLGGDYFMSVTADYLKKYMNSSNWVEVQAAYTAMAYMSDGCKDSFSKNIKEFLQFISTGLIHKHPRVRYAALFAFGSVLKSTAPKPQKEFTNNILPALAQLMSDKEPSIRVKTQSCNSLLEYLRGLLNDELTSEESNALIASYSSDLVQLLSQLFEFSLKENYYPLQEATLGSLSLLSNLLEKNFAPYYDKLMPGLKKLFFGLNAQTIEQKKLKSNTIETMSYLCSSIAEERDKYMEDLTTIAKAFLDCIKTLPEEDPQLPSVMNGFTHLSLSMKEAFAPILEQLLPVLTKYINADIDISAMDAALGEYIPSEKEAKSKIQSVVLGTGSVQTKLSLNTFALQNKIASYSVLYEIAKNMGKGFVKFVETLLNLSKNYFDYSYSPKIRKISFKSVTACLEAVSTTEEKKKILEFIGPTIINSFQKGLGKGFLKDIKKLLKAMTFSFDSIKDKMVFTEKFITDFYSCLNKTCKLVDEKKGVLIASLEGEGVDEDEEDDLLQDYDYYCEIERKIMEISGILFKLFGAPLTGLVAQNLFDSFKNNWNNALQRKKMKSDLEVLTSICFFDDFIEHGAIEGVVICINDFIDNTIRYETENEDILQSIVFGYGVICKKLSKDQFKQYNASILTYIGNLMQREVNEDNGRTYDNAVSALGKYLIYQSNNNNDSINMAKQIIKSLPLKNDMEESKVLCTEIFNQIKANNPIFMNDANIGELKQTIIDIKKLNDEKKFLEEQEETLKEIAGKFGI